MTATASASEIQAIREDFLTRFPDALLTGSRLFGGATEGSDWDYIVPTSGALTKYLDKEHATRNSPTGRYLNQFVTAVWGLPKLHIITVFPEAMPIFEETQSFIRQFCPKFSSLYDFERKYLYRKVLRELNSLAFALNEWEERK